MKSKQIQKFVMRYLEAQNCQILEKSPAHVTVKLSPEADKDLTNRSYYWSFVERTGAEPETMTFTFIFDKEKMEQEPGPGKPAGAAATAAAQPDSILGRYLGVSVPAFTGRIPREELTFGCRRLEQIFASVRNRGKYVHLFEEPEPGQRAAPLSAAYSTWLCVNYKVELACDMKRDELHSLGIHLLTGQIAEHFHDRLLALKLTPRLPANIHLQPNKMTLDRAATLLEAHLEKKLKQHDHRWAREAQERLAEEQGRIRSYYENLFQTIEADKKIEVQEEYYSRQKEIEWQYRPRIRASVINCGLFHLKQVASGSN